MIDFYKFHANNAHLLEFGVGKGKILATSLNLLPNVEKKLELRNLLAALTAYALGDRFAPTARVPATEFLRLFAQRPRSAVPKTSP